MLIMKVWIVNRSKILKKENNNLKKEDDNMTGLHVRINKELHMMLKMVAAKRNITIGLLVSRATAKYIKRDLEK